MTTTTLTARQISRMHDKLHAAWIAGSVSDRWREQLAEDIENGEIASIKKARGVDGIAVVDIDGEKSWHYRGKRIEWDESDTYNKYRTRYAPKVIKREDGSTMTWRGGWNHYEKLAWAASSIDRDIEKAKAEKGAN